MEVGLLAWIAGGVLSLIGWGTLVHYAWIVRTWPAARGRVVGNVAEWSGGGGVRRVAYYPEIEFDVGGTLHRARGGVGKRREWEIGTPVALHYDPANPEHVLDLDVWQRMLFSGVFIVLGGVSLAAAMGWVR